MRRCSASFLSTLCTILGMLSPVSGFAQTAPATTPYVISGPNGTNFTVDDGLDVSLNGMQFYTDGAAQSGSRAPITFNGKTGDQLTFVVRDTYGFCSSLSPLYLSCKGGNTFTLADPGFNLGCGRPSGNQGVVHTANFTIPASLSCQAANIAAVEVSQAIQQYQTLADLKASLTAGGEPPIPIIAGKPAVLRVYFAPVTDVTTLTLNLTGDVAGSASIDLQPNCKPEDQRANANGCQSQDFYFTPPSGTFTVTLDVLDSSGNQTEEEVLNFKTRTTDSMLLKAVSVCDAMDAAGNWLCAPAAELMSKIGLLRKIAPTATVNVQVTSNTVQADASDSFLFAMPDDWWLMTVKSVNGLYGRFDSGLDVISGVRTTYYGMVRDPSDAVDATNLGGIGGIADTIPGHGAMGRVHALRFTSNTDTNVEVVAHEMGHTLGLLHTNTMAPAVSAAPPGCYNLAEDAATDWLFPDNFVQDSKIKEFGFDVATQRILDPARTFEVSSYCSPRWISPLHYKVMIANLSGGVVTSPSAARSTAPVKQPFWLVSGTIKSAGVTFDPLFQVTSFGDATVGSGTYQLQVRDAANAVLFTRAFTPFTGTTETKNKDVARTPSFTQTIPVVANAAALVLLGPTAVELGRITLAGTPPVVTFTAPAAGFTASGTQTVSWQVTGATTFTSLLFYSTDNGATWSQIAQVQKSGRSTRVNFDALPGSAQVLLQVLVSDGVNTGTATTANLTVARKKPSLATIDSPPANYAQAGAAPLYLSGSVYDTDDGSLTGAALKWTSDIQGALGTGSPLSAALQPGTHVITLTGTDSDGNTASTSVSVLIGGARPVLTLATFAVSGSCTGATITAAPGAKGAALSKVEYSLDGGVTYQPVALGSLPYSFVVPGSGAINLVARAYDATRQSAAKSAQLSVPTACAAGVPSLSAGGTQSTTIGGAFAQPLSVVVNDPSGKPVAGVTVTFTVPGSGASAVLSSATAVSGANGIASVTATANATAGAYIVVASVAGFSTTVPFGLSNTDFTLAGADASVTVKHGSSTTTTLTIAPLGGFASTITLACSGLPTGVTCSFSPATITPSTGNSTTTLTIAAADNAKLTAALGGAGLAGGVALAFCLCGLLARRGKRMRSLLMVLLATALLYGASGCGASFAPFTSTVTVNATSGMLSHSSAIKVMVQ